MFNHGGSMSRLDRYRDKKLQIKKIDDYNKSNYRSFNFRLHKEKDKELISLLDQRTKSIAAILRDWYSKTKKKEH